jgi:hypothetical protein
MLSSPEVAEGGFKGVAFAVGRCAFFICDGAGTVENGAAGLVDEFLSLG